MDTTQIKSKLEEVSSFFNNPLTTPIGQIIDHLTTPTPTTTPSQTNWPLLLELCDLLNTPTDASTFTNYSKAIKKKLTSKNPQTIELTLTLIEVTLKNCSENNEKFTNVVLSREFLLEVVKGGCSGGTTTQDKTLGLIQSLNMTFKNNPQVWSVYEELRDKGLEFPAISLDEMAPIIFKPRPQQVLEEEEPVLHPVRFKGTPTVIRPTLVQKAKLRRELGVVQSNLSVLNELLSEKEVGVGEAEFLESLHSTCKEMQSRLTQLLTQIDPQDSDDLISELLQVNDDLNNGFLRYTRYTKNKAKSHQPHPQNVPMATEQSLIDFSVQPTAASGAIPKQRNVELESVESLGIFIEGEEFQVLQNHTENDFKEMEAWLESGCFPPKEESNPPLSSSEFDRFLEERARKK